MINLNVYMGLEFTSKLSLYPDMNYKIDYIDEIYIHISWFMENKDYGLYMDISETIKHFENKNYNLTSNSINKLRKLKLNRIHNDNL